MTSGNCAISSEGVRAAGRGGRAADTTEDAEDDDWDGQGKCAACVADGGCYDDGERLSDRGQEGDVGEDEAEWYEEDEAADQVEDDGGDHGFGDLSRRLFDFFAHAAWRSADRSDLEKSDEASLLGMHNMGGKHLRKNHASRGSRVGRVKKTDEERPTGWPT